MTAEAGRATRRAGRLAGALMSVAVLAAGCSPSGSRPSRTPAHHPAARHTAAAARCPLPARAFLQAADLPQLAEFVSYGRDELPIHTLAFKPLWFVRKYSCGSFYGFIARVALKGRFRAENNASARASGYPIGKWPEVPLTGRIISALPHSILEIYEGAYRFSSPSAAAAYVAVLRPDFPHHIAIPGLPAGFFAAVQVFGADRHTNERQIAVIGRFDSTDVTVWLQGGQDLAWSDVVRYWNESWARLQQLRT